MNILLLGSGGREHALAWKLVQSPQCRQLFIAPGNPGTEQHGTNVNLDPLDFAAIKRFISDRNIEMLVVGPEAPLVAGIFDFFEGDSVMVIGPSRQGALLEGSKSFAKEFMMRHNVPTAGYKEFTKETREDALIYLEQQDPPIVLKADGLAAGKGVLICQTVEEAKTAFEEMIHGRFGGAGEKVVVEEFLNGKEVSVFVLTDGKNFKLLAPAKDYKRIGEDDTGLNTGGMGAVSPVSFADKNVLRKVEEHIVIPTINGLAKDGIRYKGILYCGLMIVEGEPFVIEFNTRLGDPEAQVVLPSLKSDLVQLFVAMSNGTLDQQNIESERRPCCTVVLVSGGYPGAYEKGKLVTGIGEVAEAIVFHAGTKVNDRGEIVTAGGRVMALTAFGDTLLAARGKALDAAAAVEFDGKYYRTDIGNDVIAR